MALQLNMIRDEAGRTTFGLEFSDTKYSTILLNGVEQTITVPGKNPRYLVIFAMEPGSEVWVANNATAAGPGGAFALTNSELNPVARYVKAGDVLHFITTNVDARTGVSFYAIQ